MGCKCPRCGQGNLYQGYLKLAARCDACQLDYAIADSGDGPAVFVIFIVGFLAVAATFILRFSMGAPIWLALLVGIVLSALLIGVIIRPLKALLIALQYANKAQEGALDQQESDQAS